MCYLAEFLLSLCLLSFALISTASAATFHIRNNCPYTLWAAATPTGGGRRLESGQNWTLNVPAAGTSVGRIWARTKCDFDASGKGHCQTGDCGGVLQCKGWGTPPNTLAEYALNQFGNMDFYDISLVDGFNVPIKFSPTSTAPTRCKPASCAADINSQCPTELKAPGGCNNPCTVFNTSEYCCTAGQGSCGPNRFSSFFRHMCPDAYSYPLDDQASTFTCPSGTDYGVVFCPSRSLTHFPVESVAEELMKQ